MEIDPPDVVKLTIVEGPGKGQEFTFREQDAVIIGRAEDCHVSLADDACYVSRYHCILEVNPPQARLYDLRSKNGIRVNGEQYGGNREHRPAKQIGKDRYPAVSLKDGDVIQVGLTRLLVSTSEGATRRVEPEYCQCCGKIIPSEAKPKRQDHFLCARCRQKAQREPLELLRLLMTDAPESGPAAFKLSDYVIETRLGEGGAGTVYLLRNKRTKAEAALKVMLAGKAMDPRSQAAFVREIEVLRNLRHKNIVDFWDHGFVKGVFYFLMEYCSGGNVAGFMTRHDGKLSLPEAAPIMRQTLEGLAFIHHNNFVHRDIKPQNILLDGLSARYNAKIADMGLAKNAARAGQSGMTITGAYAGTPSFMPREQITSFKYTQPASDIWSVGATFYHLLTGLYPRAVRPGQALLEVILNSEIIPIRQRIPDLPASVAEVIDRSLARDVDARYASAGEMYVALIRVL